MPRAAPESSWLDLTWVEWAGLLGIVATLVGVWLTWRQARNASTAARAASAAIARTQRQLKANHLLVLAPQLRWIASEIDAAIELNDHKLVRRYLDNWRWQAGNIRGALDGESSDHVEMRKSIQEAVSLAQSAAGELLEQPPTKVIDRCARARTAINAVCDELNVWVGKNATALHGEGEEQ